MRIFNCFFENYRNTEIKIITNEEKDKFEPLVEPLFFFILTWSIGCTIDYDSRIKFNAFLRKMMADNNASI